MRLPDAAVSRVSPMQKGPAWVEGLAPEGLEAAQSLHVNTSLQVVHAPAHTVKCPGPHAARLECERAWQPCSWAA